ncbi:MAG: PD-(D/E)XK nuclease-like domain-containing protein, partial [Minisyncoccota bacterium]
EPGIYFNLAEDEYHADPALGSSSIKAIAVDEFEYQFDHLYGDDQDTDALIFGSALHARILEGREAFERKFCSEFDKSTVEGALDTVTEIKDWLDKYGQAGLSGKAKPALIALVQSIDPSQPIVDVIKGAWNAANEGKTALKPKRWAQIETAARWVQRDPLLSAVMEDGTFSHGAPEVSIFYEDRGVRLKARLDRLLRHAIIDLKSFAPRSVGKIEHLALVAIRRMNYDIQAADYLRAWRYAKELFAAGKIYGEQPFSTFLEECFDRQEPKWIWVMVKSVGAPQPLVIDWQATLAMRTAAEDVERAIDTYRDMRDKYGVDAEWPPMRPAITATDSMLPF